MKIFHVLKGLLILSTLSLLANSVFASTIMGIGGIAKKPITDIKARLTGGAPLDEVVRAASEMGFEITVR